MVGKINWQGAQVTDNNIITALAILATLFSFFQQPPPVTWYGIALFALFILVSLIVIGASIWTAAKLLRDFKNTNSFVMTLKTQIGTNGGSSLSERLRKQDEKLEEARVLADKRYKEATDWAEQARVARLQLTLEVDKITRSVAAMQAESKWQQEYNKLHAELIARGINLRIDNAAAQAQAILQTAPATIAGHDSNAVDVSGRAGAIIAGANNEQTTGKE